ARYLLWAGKIRSAIATGRDRPVGRRADAGDRHGSQCRVWRIQYVTRLINGGLDQLMEDSKACTERSPMVAEDVICESDSRIEIFGIPIGFPNVRHINKSTGIRRIRNLIQVVLRFGRIRAPRISQSQIERESPRRFPVVLEIWSDPQLAE